MQAASRPMRSRSSHRVLVVSIDIEQWKQAACERVDQLAPALLAASVGVELVVETDGGELLLAEPGLERHVQADVDGGAVAGEDDDVLHPAREPHAQRALQA